MMQDLVQWYNAQVNEGVQHPLLIVGVFIVVFLAIHPFKMATVGYHAF